MKSKTARQIIDEMDLPNDQQVNFMQLYDAGFELMDEMLKANESSAVRVYLHLIKNMDRNSGALVTELDSIMSDLSISLAILYRTLNTLKKSGHLITRHRNLFEVNPDGAWKGYTKRKNNAMFMMSDEKATSKGVRLRLNPGSKHPKAITTLATFEPALLKNALF